MDGTWPSSHVVEQRCVSLWELRWWDLQIISCWIGHLQGTKGTKATEATKMMENIGKIFFPDD
ncbi:MAG: hypothetical protein IKN52_10925, partial [Victivallales bacterium]|nr:hypothetical protein [Victivallales bacterium]